MKMNKSNYASIWTRFLLSEGISREVVKKNVESIFNLKYKNKSLY